MVCCLVNEFAGESKKKENSWQIAITLLIIVTVTARLLIPMFLPLWHIGQLALKYCHGFQGFSMRNTSRDTLQNLKKKGIFSKSVLVLFSVSF